LGFLQTIKNLMKIYVGTYIMFQEIFNLLFSRIYSTSRNVKNAELRFAECDNDRLTAGIETALLLDLPVIPPSPARR
jgi:hypothetical protein